MKYEFEILVNRYGNVLVYKREGKRLTFWNYAKSIEWAVSYCADHPTTIIRQC